MIDLHAHIMPGVDDGAPDMDESLAMAELAVSGGTTYLTATPHSNQMGRFENFAGRDLRRSYSRLKAAVAEEGIPLNLLLGMEIFASEDMAEKIRDGRLIGLNQTRYFLVEFPFDEEPERIQWQLQSMQAVGATPLVAHPERYDCVQDHPALVYQWLQMGCYAQLNKGSLNGAFGRQAERTALALLQDGLITCVASDAHSALRRTPHMEAAEYWLRTRMGERIASLLLEENPRRILTNREVAPHGRPPKQKSYF